MLTSRVGVFLLNLTKQTIAIEFRKTHSMKKILYIFLFCLASSCWNRNPTFKIASLTTNFDTFDVSHEFHTLCTHHPGDTAFIAFDLVKDSVMKVSFNQEDIKKDFVLTSGLTEKLVKVKWAKGLVIEKK